MPPREAAATGLPVITTEYGGLAEDIHYWALPLRVARLSKAEFGWYDCDIGQWAEPDLDELIHRMRCLAERPEIGRTFGQHAANWLASRTPWSRTAQALLQVMGAS